MDISHFLLWIFSDFCWVQAKALITQLQEQTRQMNDAITSCDAAIESGDVSQVPDAALRIKPEFRDPEYTKVLNDNGNGNREVSWYIVVIDVSFSLRSLLR